MPQTDKQKTGELGEDIACKFLVKHGYKIIDRNYNRKWGEIDIIATKNNKLYFVEVKTVSHETSGYNPEDNVHPWKIKRLYRTIETYLLDNSSANKAGEEIEWQLDILAVFLNIKTRKAKIRVTENIIL